jgi:hypothetical protein
MLVKEADTHAGVYETHAPRMQRMLLKEAAAVHSDCDNFSFFFFKEVSAWVRTSAIQAP